MWLLAYDEILCSLAQLGKHEAFCCDPWDSIHKPQKAPKTTKPPQRPRHHDHKPTKTQMKIQDLSSASNRAQPTTARLPGFFSSVKTIFTSEAWSEGVTSGRNQPTLWTLWSHQKTIFSLSRPNRSSLVAFHPSSKTIKETAFHPELLPFASPFLLPTDVWGGKNPGLGRGNDQLRLLLQLPSAGRQPSSVARAETWILGRCKTLVLWDPPEDPLKWIQSRTPLAAKEMSSKGSLPRELTSFCAVHKCPVAQKHQHLWCPHG